MADQPKRLTRTVRIMLCVAAGLAALAPVSSPAAAPRTPATAFLAFDRMEYVVEAPRDPYSDTSSGKPDGSSVHVGVAANGNPAHLVQQDYARSYLHLALDRLPKDAAFSKIGATFYLTDKTELSNGSVYQIYYQDPNHQALMQACALAAPIPAALTNANEPAADCAHGSAVGTLALKSDNVTPDHWTFDLTPLLKVWSVAGNTGLVILPIGGDQSDAWTVSLSKGRSILSKVDYTTAPVPTPTVTPSKPAPVTYYRVPVTITNPYPLPTAPPSVAPSVAPSAPSEAPREVASAPVPTSAQRTWVWVLPTCLAAAALVLALARRPAFAGRGTPLKIRIFSDVRSYPRSYAAATIVALWGVLFASYAAVTTPVRTTVAGPAIDGTQAPSATAPSTAPGASAAARPSTSTTYKTVQAGGGGPIVPGSEFEGPGTYRTIGNVPVFFPANGGPPAAKLYSGADDVTGLDFTNKRVKLCGHAALTFGPEFNIDTKDINVFWDYLNAHGGIDGWKFDLTLNDDGYDPQKAVQAAQKCKDAGAFEILGGIGFDQIPAVRSWAEVNQQLYVHHVVTTAGSEGLRYSYSALPSEESMGKMAGRLAIEKFRGKKIGVIWRQSPNWQSGRDLFEKMVRDCSCQMQIFDHPVTLQQSNYTQEIATMKNTEHVDVVFAWENALATDEIIEQALGQDFHPAWIVFPFNLELDTLDTPRGALPATEQIYGVAAWDAYDPSFQGRGYASYKPLMDEFKKQYDEMGDPSGPTNTKGNDLLFLTWEGWYGLADLFRACLPNCTRNRMAGVMLTYHHQIPYFCDSDFTRLDGHHGGWVANYFQYFRTPDGRPAWDPYARCVSVP